MECPLISNNREKFHCQCQIQRSLICPMDCCYSCFYLLLESSPNLASNFCRANETKPLLIPKKEKELFLKCQKAIQDKVPQTQNKKINNYTPRYFNKLNVNLPSKLNNLNINHIIKDEFSENRKTKYKQHLVLNSEIHDPKKNKIIKVNKIKKEKTITIPVSNTLKNEKINKIDINNFIPFSHKKKLQGKYINNYELNKDEIRNNHSFEISINKKSINNRKIMNHYRKYSLINNFDDKKKFNSLLTNKIEIDDLNDENVDIGNYSLKNDENKIIFLNLKNEIGKEKEIIKNLTLENEILKNKLFKIKQNNIKGNKINDNKSIHIPNFNEEENKNEKQYIIQNNNFGRKINELKQEITEINFKMKEYENTISILKNLNNDQEKIIKMKDKEISELMLQIDILKKENKDKINELNIKEVEIFKEKENISNDYKINNDILRKEILNLNSLILNRDKKIKDLEIKLKYEKKYYNKKQTILELLFNFYNNIINIINFDKSNYSLKDIIEITNIDDFEYKLKKMEKKLKQIIDDIQIKYGHCFACDIACCTSHVDKLKAFRSNGKKNK